MGVQSLKTSGSALASLFQEVSALRGPFEGLLIGSFRQTQESIIHDTAEETMNTVTEAYISDICCSRGLGSFYNAAGEIEVEEVMSIAKACKGDVLGWLIHQAGPRRSPSARERTITAGMAACVPPGMPVFFGVASLALDRDGATVTFQLQIHEQEPGTVVLQPVEMMIDNLGSANRSRDYKPLRPIPGQKPISASRPSNQPSRDQNGANLSLNSAASNALFFQAVSLEQYFKDMLKQMSSEGKKVAHELDELRLLQQEVDAIAMSLQY